MGKVLNGHEYIPSKLVSTELFNSSITQALSREVEPQINEIIKGLKKYGVNFLFAQKNFKLLVGHNKIFEIRSRIKGHRILFKFAKDISFDLQIHSFIEQCDDYDMFLLKYVSNHDEISDEASKIDNRVLTINDIDLLEHIPDKESINIDDCQIKKLYYCQNYKFLIPVLNKQQKDILFENERCVLVQGIAGAGKTNICIQKCILEAIKDEENKILYATYSKELLEYTKKFIQENYIIPIQEIINEFDSSDFNNNAVSSMANNLDINIKESDYNKETFIELKNKLRNIDYSLLSQIDKSKVATFEYFSSFVSNKLSYVLKNEIKNEYLTNEVIFKEIEGVIFGFLTNEMIENLNIESFNKNVISCENYVNLRKNDFSEKQLKVIYDVAEKYLNYLLLEEKAMVLDKNIIAFNIYKKEINNRNNNITNFKYDMVILDEVQDFTQKELFAYSVLAPRIFAVGDTRQMINPSYFSFDELKRILDFHSKEHELTLNYRNTEILNTAVKDLINFGIRYFGNWNDFTNEIKTTESTESSSLGFSEHDDLLHKLLDTDFDNYTIIVPTEECKDKFKVKNKEQIQTVSEFKGKESGLVILYNVLSLYKEQWNHIYNGLQTKNIKVNSIYRYYYNLFYVAITRAKRHLLIVEDDLPEIFRNEKFFQNFKYYESNTSIDLIKQEFDLNVYSDEERLIFIKEYLDAYKFDSAQYQISELKNESLRNIKQVQYNIYVNFVVKEEYEKARDEFLKNNLIDDAIEMCNKLGAYNDGLLLKDFNSDMNFATLMNIYFTTKSEFIKKLANDKITNERNETIRNSNTIRELLKEIR